jgi:hypothetical protein
VELGVVVRADKLFDAFRKDAFRKDILRGAGAPSRDELVPRLWKNANIMRSFDDFEPGTPEELFFSRMEAMDTTTLLPIALYSSGRGSLSRIVVGGRCGRWKAG